MPSTIRRLAAGFHVNACVWSCILSRLSQISCQKFVIGVMSDLRYKWATALFENFLLAFGWKSYPVYRADLLLTLLPNSTRGRILLMPPIWSSVPTILLKKVTTSQSLLLINVASCSAKDKQINGSTSNNHDPMERSCIILVESTWPLIREVTLYMSERGIRKMRRLAKLKDEVIHFLLLLFPFSRCLILISVYFSGDQTEVSSKIWICCCYDRGTLSGTK